MLPYLQWLNVISKCSSEKSRPATFTLDFSINASIAEHLGTIRESQCNDGRVERFHLGHWARVLYSGIIQRCFVVIVSCIHIHILAAIHNHLNQHGLQIGSKECFLTFSTSGLPFFAADRRAVSPPAFSISVLMPSSQRT